MDLTGFFVFLCRSDEFGRKNVTTVLSKEGIMCQICGLLEWNVC